MNLSINAKLLLWASDAWEEREEVVPVRSWLSVDELHAAVAELTAAGYFVDMVVEVKNVEN